MELRFNKSYLDGDSKTYWRGYLHRYCGFLLLPLHLALLTLTYQTHVFYYGCIFAFGTIFCYIVSAIYHTTDWISVELEHKWQQLDHFAASTAFACSGTMAALLFEHQYQPTIHALNWSILALAGIAIVYYFKTKWSLKLNAINFVVFHSLYFLLQSSQLAWAIVWMWASCLCMGLGGLFFFLCIEWPIPYIFSYHEVMHLCTIIHMLIYTRIWAGLGGVC
jgi:predicted membrane channel-forming protein YqfA (hemolysin III family)